MSAPSPKAETLSNTGKRVRTSKPKVRSGCVTCKTRRIKCDEAKPFCSRCTKFGRECGGYKHQLSYEERLASRNKQSLLPKVEERFETSVMPSTSQRLGATLGLTTQQLFCVEASLELCQTLDLPYWTSTNLRICKQYPFVRHAFSAIRMLSKRPSTQDNHDPSIALLASLETEPHDQNLAALHQGCFLEGARTALPNGFNDLHQIRFTAVICLLTICLETLQFRHEPALSHIQVAVGLAPQLLAHNPPPSQAYLASLHVSDIEVDSNFTQQIVKLFQMLETRASAMDACFPLYAPMPLGFTSPFATPYVEPQAATLSEVTTSYTVTDQGPSHSEYYTDCYTSRGSSISSTT